MQYLRDIVGLAALGWPLTLLVVIAIFFAISIVVAVQVSKRTKRKALWGWGIVLAAYLLIFWDHIPTILVHKYYCEKEAGFWVYKTLDQWKAENPGVMETLVANKGDRLTRNGDMDNYVDTYFVNQRFALVVKHNGKLLLNRWRHEREVVDGESNTVLARYVDFSTSQIRQRAGWSGWKFWLDSRNCPSGHDQKIQFGEYYLQFKGTEK